MKWCLVNIMAIRTIGSKKIWELDALITFRKDDPSKTFLPFSVYRLRISMNALWNKQIDFAVSYTIKATRACYNLYLPGRQFVCFGNVHMSHVKC